MSLEDLLNDKLIVKHRPSAGGIAELLHICDRDLEKVEIIGLAKQLRDDVEQWLRAHYPSLAREI